MLPMNQGCFTSLHFYCLPILAVTSSTMLNKSRERGHPCFLPNLTKNIFSNSPLSVKLICIFHMFFSMLSEAPSVSNLQRSFIKNGYWILSNAFCLR